MYKIFPLLTKAVCPNLINKGLSEDKDGDSLTSQACAATSAKGSRHAPLRALNMKDR